MAASTLKSFKCPANLVLLRYLRDAKHLLKVCQFSTCKFLSSKEKPPVKFSTSSAAKVSIKETIGLASSSPDEKLKKFIILGTVAIFLVYFCIIREENDLDEKLTTTPNVNSDEFELIQLKIKLAYSEKTNLPTAKLKARIQELVDKNTKPVFLK